MAETAPDPRAALEGEIRRCCEAGDFEAATTVALRGYGPEILGFLAATHRNETDAGEVFSDFCEGVWKSLPSFVWQSSFRTWAYTIARRASMRLIRAPIRRASRNVPIDSSSVAKVAEQLRSQTATYLRTSVKDRVAQIREALEPDDRLLLVLRVDKQLAWNEVAQVMLEDESPSAETLKRESARLRKRFELVKAKILELGKQHGLRRDE